MSSGSIVSEQMDEFRQALGQWDAIGIVQRYITVGDPIALLNSQHVELKQSIATKFAVHHTEVFVVGSAKLGFSIAPRKRWRLFSDTSDLDVAIVSRTLYEQVWREVSNLVTVDPFVAWDKKGRFSGYHMHGWIRPDLLPSSPALTMADDWFEFFRELTSRGSCGPYKISAGLYYDMHFLEQYQSRAVELCKIEKREQEDEDRSNEQAATGDSHGTEGAASRS